MRPVPDKEFEAVCQPDGPERYAHFVNRVADWEEVWTLRSEDGWVLYGDGKTDVVPVWPYARYAEACATGDWAGSQAVPIPIEDWMERWLPSLESDDRSIAVFPLSSGKGVVAEAAMLQADLQAELSQCE